MRKINGSLFLGFLFVVAILAFVLFKFWKFMNSKPLLNEQSMSILNYKEVNSDARNRTKELDKKYIDEMSEVH